MTLLEELKLCAAHWPEHLPAVAELLNKAVAEIESLQKELDEEKYHRKNLAAEADRQQYQHESEKADLRRQNAELAAERDALKVEYESRAIWIEKMVKILGCENKDGFNCRDVHEVASQIVKQNAELRECLKVKDEALQSCKFKPKGYAGLESCQTFNPTLVAKALALKLDAMPSGLSAGQSVKLEKERDDLRRQNAELQKSHEPEAIYCKLEELTKERDALQKQNAELRECLKVKDEALQLAKKRYALHFAKTIDELKTIKTPFDKALAAQPEGGAE